MKDADTTPHEFDSMVTAMDLPTLDTLIAFAMHVRAEKHTERVAKLQEEAHELGATVKLNGHRGRRGRKPKHE